MKNLKKRSIKQFQLLIIGLKKATCIIAKYSKRYLTIIQALVITKKALTL